MRASLFRCSETSVVGNAFRGQDDETLRKIIFLLTPSIIADERLWEMGEDGSRSSTPSARLAGRSPALQPDQITADYNRDAIEAFRRGLDLAFYYANNSLRTASVQPEMIRMRAFGSTPHEAWNRNMQRPSSIGDDLVPAGTSRPPGRRSGDLQVIELPGWSRNPDADSIEDHARHPSLND